MIEITEIVQVVNVDVDEINNSIVLNVTEQNNIANVVVSDIGLQGVGVPMGGTTGQVLAKINNTDYNTQWVTGLTLSNIITNEVPSGLINGSNATFTSANNFVSGSLQVFLNGSLQKIIDDYQVIGNNTINLNFSPFTNENLLINYIKL